MRCRRRNLDTVVSEVANAVRGRGRDLARLSEYSTDLPERILVVESQLRSMIETGPRVNGVLADNADVLADDITRTAQLADILRDRRYDLVDLYRNGARFTRVAGELIADEKANLACLVRDFGYINNVLAAGENLANLAASLDLNHFFFGGIDQIVQKGLDGRDWFRVQLPPHTEPPARLYRPQRDISDVYAATPAGRATGAVLVRERSRSSSNSSQARGSTREVRENMSATVDEVSAAPHAGAEPRRPPVPAGSRGPCSQWL